MQTSRVWIAAVPLSAAKDAVVKRGAIIDVIMAASKSMLEILIFKFYNIGIRYVNTTAVIKCKFDLK